MGARLAGHGFPASSLEDGATTGTLNVDGSLNVDHGYIVLDTSDLPETSAPEQHWLGRSGGWINGVDVANVLKSRDYVSVGRLYDFAFDDGATTNGSATLTSPAQGGFASSMVGASLSGAGIPAGTTVLAVASALSLTMSANATATASGVRVVVDQDGVNDIIYLTHRGRRQPTIGLGVTPPSGDYQVEASGHDGEPAMGALGLRIGPAQTGHPFAVADSSGWVAGLRQWLTKDVWWAGRDAGLQARGDTTNQRSLVLTDSAVGGQWAFTHPTGSGGIMKLTYLTGGADLMAFETNGGVRHLSSRLGFYGAASITKPAVTGLRAGNTTLTLSLLAALANLGILTDSTT